MFTINEVKVGDKFLLRLTKSNPGIPIQQHGNKAKVIFVPPDLGHPKAEFYVDTGFHYPWGIPVSMAQDALVPFKDEGSYLLL